MHCLLLHAPSIRAKVVGVQLDGWSSIKGRIGLFTPRARELRWDSPHSAAWRISRKSTNLTSCSRCSPTASCRNHDRNTKRISDGAVLILQTRLIRLRFSESLKVSDGQT